MLKILSVSVFAILLLSITDARADQVPGDLHLCNADEITNMPVLQSQGAYECTSNQNTESNPKVLMCAPPGKAFCCTQKLTEIGACEPVIGGKKRSVPLRDPMLPPSVQPAPMGTPAPQ